MGSAERVSRGVHRLRTLMANVYFISDGTTPSARWVLVDAGIRGYAGAIRREAEQIFQCAPSAIVLTHGHFDHVGNVEQLADAWGAAIYAHPLELPYLTGASSYPPPDPSVGGGVLARSAALYPRGPIDLGARVRMLPSDGTVPGVNEWQWFWTPGHTPGHVSFFRTFDRTLIAGDAVVATRQESLIHVLLQREVVSRPPAYFTPDWHAAKRSVVMMATLEPNVLGTGHGRAIAGEGMRRALRHLADHFEEGMPAHGRYVGTPAVADQSGTVHVPPRPAGVITPRRMAIGAAAVGVGLIAVARRR